MVLAFPMVVQDVVQSIIFPRVATKSESNVNSNCSQSLYFL